MQMLKDITMFDNLYEKNIEYFRELQIYIAAGEEKIAELREETLPKLHGQAAEKGRRHGAPRWCATLKIRLTGSRRRFMTLS